MVERSHSMSDVAVGESSSSIIVDIEGDEYLGKVLNGRYRIDKRLGVGGYGIVYEGVYLENDTPVAIKMLRATEDHNQEVRARFRREGEALSNLQNIHTVRTYEFNYDENGSMFIAMELLHGKTLKDELRKLGYLPWRRALGVLIQICEALTEAHASGYVHRDLKPENIYLCERDDGEDMVKVLDFGIAKKLAFGANDGETQLTAHGQTVGTMRYMSPEQLLGQPVDSRSDIYSLGVLAHRMLTGRVPFPKAKNMARLIAAQLQQAPKPPSVSKPKAEIPAAVDRLVLLMLEKTAPARLPNSELLRMACQEILDTGDWSGADRYDRKSKNEPEEDQTAPAEAVTPESISSMLSPEAQADLAVIAGGPVAQEHTGASATADVTEKTALVMNGTQLNNPPNPMPNDAPSANLAQVNVNAGGSTLKFVFFAAFFAAAGGAVVYFLL